MLRIITFNLNGIRSAVKKGFFDWVSQQNADVICVQELRAQECDLQEESFKLPGYYAVFCYAKKKGYSGVGIYSRAKPTKVVTQLHWETADQEGRYVAVELDSVWVASLYMPSGTSGEERQTIKYAFLDQYRQYLKRHCLPNRSTILQSGPLKKIKVNIFSYQKEYIICGDWNIAHKPIDLKNWRANQQHSGFLKEERAWMDDLFDKLGFVDAFRVANPSAEEYTWWSNRGRAWEKNVGWRIDYQILTPSLRQHVKNAFIYKEKRFSDHAPLIIDYDI